MVIAAPMANALFPPEDVDASSSDAAFSAVDRLSPWAPFSSVSVTESVEGVAASSMELDSSGAVLSELLSDESSVSEDPEEESPALLCREEPELDEPLPELLSVLLLPELLLPEELLPDEVPPELLLPDASVTMVAFISVLFPAV